MAKDDKSKIIIYGAAWCPPCHIAKQYLDSKKIAYQYIDIDKDPEAGMEISKQTGWSSIPIIQVGEEFILGFNREQLDGALRSAKLLG